MAVSLIEIILGIVVGGLLLFLYLVYWFAYAPYQFFKRYGINGPKPVAYLGNVHELLKMDGINRGAVLSKQYGPVIGYYVGRLPFISITDLDILKQIMVKQFDNFSDHVAFPNLLLEGTDLFNEKGEKWKATRKTLSPAFSASKLKMMLPLLKRSTDNLVAVMEEKAAAEKSFDICVVYSSFTMETILATAFGRRVNLQKGESDDLSELINLMFSDQKPGDLLKFFVLFGHFPWIISLLKLFMINNEPAKAGRKLAKVALDLVKARREEGYSGKHKDILQLMIEASGEEGDSDEEKETEAPPAECPAHKTTKTKGIMTDKEVVANSFGFLFAGNETTATTLSFASYLLALHPDIQEKLQSEIDDYFEEKPEASLYTAAQEISYLDNVVQETLRLYPPALETNRYCNRTSIINGVTIPKGAAIVVPIYTIHHSPLYWKDPEKFDPDRFTAEERAKRHQLCHIPFGFGPRSCIGLRLALLEAKIALIEVLQKYTFVKTDKTEEPLQLTAVGLGLIRAKNGITLKVINRL